MNHTTRNDLRNNFGAFLLIGLGVLFLLGQIFNFNLFGWLDMGDLWPLFVMLPGLALVAVAFFGGRQAAPLVFPGAAVTTTGGILFLQNAGILPWEGWAYLWALYPAAVGLAMIFFGRRTGQNHLATQGGRILMIGAVLLAVFAVFFELIIFGGNAGILGSSLWRYGLPVLLIAIGALMLLRRRERYAPLPKVKRTYSGPSAQIDPSLKRKIDQALEEDDRVA